MDQSFICPVCKKKAVPLLYGIINILRILFGTSLKCGHCKTELQLIKGTKRLLILCALLGWLVGVIVSGKYQIISGSAIFILFISAPALMNRKFFEKSNK